MSAWLRRHYGSGPLHLVALVACFALAGYAVLRVLHDNDAVRIAVWFAGAVIAHDVLLFPLYSLVDRSLSSVHGRQGRPAAALWLNHVRIPAAISLLLLLIWSPLIFGWSSVAYRAASGLSIAPYLGRWLLVTGLLFSGSAVALAIRLRRRATQTQPKG